MAEYMPAPTFPGVAYTAGKMDIGSARAAGIEQAGKGIAAGISSLGTQIGDYRYRSQTAQDTLAAMNQSGILSDKAYQSVAGKSVGAQEQMLGMYAGQWIAQQAQNRELQKLGYAGDVQHQVEHANLLDKFTAVRLGYGAAAGVNQRNILLGAGGQGGVPTAAPGQPVLTNTATGLAMQPAANLTPQMVQRAAQIGGGQLGQGANISQPTLGTAGPILGKPITRGTPLAPGATYTRFQKGNQTVDFVRNPDGTVQEIVPDAAIAAATAAQAPYQLGSTAPGARRT